MESILTDILMKVSDVLTQKMALRVSDVLTHPGQRCPDTCQLYANRLFFYGDLSAWNYMT